MNDPLNAAATTAPENDNETLTLSLRRDMGLLSERDLCALLEVKNTTLRAWRADASGPVFARLGQGIFYRREDVLAWVQSRISYPVGHARLQAVG